MYMYVYMKEKLNSIIKLKGNLLGQIIVEENFFKFY